MIKGFFSAFNYKKLAYPRDKKKSTRPFQETTAVDNYGFSMDLNNYESGLEEFLPCFSNGSIEEITGYSQEEFATGLIAWDKLVHPEDLPIFYQEDQRLKNKEGHVFNIEYRIKHRNGEIRWVKDIGRVLVNPAERTPQLIGTICDITDKKKRMKAR